MANKKKNKAKMRLSTVLPVVGGIILIVMMTAAYVSDLVMIAAKKQELAGVQTQLDQQLAGNAELQRILDGGDAEIQERVARDTYDYAAPNERVFVDMSGK